MLTPRWLEQLHSIHSSPGGKRWHPVRACGLDTLTSRFYLAWLVFTGRADALLWPSHYGLAPQTDKAERE